MEKTTKYGSSGWLRSKLLVALLAFSAGFAQSSESGSTLKTSFSMAALEAYQENSLEKIGDFYHYLNLLSATTDSGLKKQIKENIYSLFEDKNILVDDVTTDKADRIPLSYLLDNIASKEMVFTLENQQSERQFFRDYWLDSYTLKITSSGKTTSRQLRQAVYLRQTEKVFGSEAKPVWSVTLGAIE